MDDSSFSSATLKNIVEIPALQQELQRWFDLELKKAFSRTNRSDELSRLALYIESTNCSDSLSNALAMKPIKIVEEMRRGSSLHDFLVTFKWREQVIGRDGAKGEVLAAIEKIENGEIEEEGDMNSLD